MGLSVFGGAGDAAVDAVEKFNVDQRRDRIEKLNALSTASNIDTNNRRIKLLEDAAAQKASEDARFKEQQTNFFMGHRQKDVLRAFSDIKGLEKQLKGADDESAGNKIRLKMISLQDFLYGNAPSVNLGLIVDPVTKENQLWEIPTNPNDTRQRIPFDELINVSSVSDGLINNAITQYPNLDVDFQKAKRAAEGKIVLEPNAAGVQEAFLFKGDTVTRLPIREALNLKAQNGEFGPDATDKQIPEGTDLSTTEKVLSGVKEFLNVSADLAKSVVQNITQKDFLGPKITNRLEDAEPVPKTTKQSDAEKQASDLVGISTSDAPIPDENSSAPDTPEIAAEAPVAVPVTEKPKVLSNAERVDIFRRLSLSGADVKRKTSKVDQILAIMDANPKITAANSDKEFRRLSGLTKKQRVSELSKLR